MKDWQLAANPSLPNLVMEVEHKTKTWVRLESAIQQRKQGLGTRMEQWSAMTFLMPAVLALLFLSIFPTIASFYLSLSRFKFARGGFELEFIGLDNYRNLLSGREQSRF